MNNKMKVIGILALFIVILCVGVNLVQPLPVYHWRPHSNWQGAGPVLHLPFYKYGANAQQIWDISGNQNHGAISGAVPYPGNPQMTSVGSTFNRGDFTSTNAFFWSSLDLSPYNGMDLGSTPFRIIVTDGVGKVATGYIGAVGAGETLGSEKVINGEFSSSTVGWEPDVSTLANITGGQSGNCLEVTSTGGTGYGYQNVGALNGELCFYSTYDKKGTAAGGKILFGTTYYNGSFATLIVADPDWTQYTGYLISGLDDINRVGIGLISLVDTKTMLFDTISLKRVTDCPITAIHIVSSLNGTTRDWASTESGFDPSTIASWKINRAIPSECIGWYFDDVNDLVAHPSINFGTDHTLLYWLRSFANAKDIIHGGATNYHVAIDGTNIYYNVGATELSQTHGGGVTNSVMIGIVRSGTTVQFFKNGIQVGANQTIDANNDLTLTTLGSYNTPGTFFGGVIMENIGFTRALSAQEIKSYYELTRHIYGI